MPNLKKKKINKKMNKKVRKYKIKIKKHSRNWCHKNSMPIKQNKSVLYISRDKKKQ